MGRLQVVGSSLQCSLEGGAFVKGTLIKACGSSRDGACHAAMRHYATKHS